MRSYTYGFQVVYDPSVGFYIAFELSIFSSVSLGLVLGAIEHFVLNDQLCVALFAPWRWYSIHMVPVGDFGVPHSNS
jgi:hypothetical protein